MSKNFKRKVSDDFLSEKIDQSLGLQMISIRLPASVITQLKEKAASQGIGYQPYVRQLLTNHVSGIGNSATSLGLEERISLIEERLRELPPAKKGSRRK